jgi:hypothetical protein
MKLLIKTLFTQDHIESLIRSGLKIVGTWLISNGMLTAGGETQFITGGVVLATGLIMSYIDKWEDVKDGTTKTAVAATPPISAPAQLAAK